MAYSGTTSTRDQAGFLYLLTLTAPGSQAHCTAAGCKGHGRSLEGDALPPLTYHSSARRTVEGPCDHPRCSCTPLGGVDLAEWNASHSRRWNHLRTALRRDVPGLQYFRGVEVQTRGALHDHAMVWSPQPLTVPQLRTLALRAGFGHSVDLAPCVAGSRKAAYYVSKYVTKATDSRDLVPWAADVVDTATGEVTRAEVPGRYRTWSMSREWGDTMTTVRAAGAVYARAQADRRDATSLADALALLDGLVFDPDPDPPPPG